MSPAAVARGLSPSSGSLEPRKLPQSACQPGRARASFLPRAAPRSPALLWFSDRPGSGSSRVGGGGANPGPRAAWMHPNQMAGLPLTLGNGVGFQEKTTERWARGSTRGSEHRNLANGQATGETRVGPASCIGTSLSSDGLVLWGRTHCRPEPHFLSCGKGGWWCAGWCQLTPGSLGTGWYYLNRWPQSQGC